MNRRIVVLVCLASAGLRGLSAAGAESGPRPTAPAQPTASTPSPRTAGDATTPDGSTPADRTAPKQGRPQPDLVEQVRENRRRLTMATIRAPDPATPHASLHEAIQRVQSIALKPRPVPTEAEPAPPSQKPASETPPETDTTASVILPPERLEELKNLPADQVTDPLALADALFCCGHLDLAYTFYDQVLADASTAKPTKAWLLLQMANCKRQSDPAAAISLYARLLTEHPKSAWAEPGKVYKTLLEWRQAMKPQAILESLNVPASEPASEGNPE